MGKILYIRTDNTFIPQVIKEDIVELDCSLTNDFCSAVGYGLIDGLKNGDGTPYYRLIKPVGRLLMDFRAEAPEQFDLLIAQWMDIFAEIFQEGVHKDGFYEIKFPQEYIYRLYRKDDEYYTAIADNLKRNGLSVRLDACELSEDVISALRQKIGKFLQSDKDIDGIVFGDPQINETSAVIKLLKDRFGDIRFFELNQFFDDQCRKKIGFCVSVDGLTLGLARQRGLEQPEPGKCLWRSGCQVWFTDGVWTHTYVTRDSPKFLDIFKTVMGEKVFKFLGNNQSDFGSCLSGTFVASGFVIIDSPRVDSGNWFRAGFKKDTKYITCIISFLKKCEYTWPRLDSRLSNKTLYSISFDLK